MEPGVGGGGGGGVGGNVESDRAALGTWDSRAFIRLIPVGS